MIEHDLIAIAVAKIARSKNDAVEHRRNRRAIVVAEVDARMKAPRACDGMDAPAERRRDGKLRCRGIESSDSEQEEHDRRLAWDFPIVHDASPCFL